MSVMSKRLKTINNPWVLLQRPV